jgi:hypothetical protein
VGCPPVVGLAEYKFQKKTLGKDSTPRLGSLHEDKKSLNHFHQEAGFAVIFVHSSNEQLFHLIRSFMDATPSSMDIF